MRESGGDFLKQEGCKGHGDSWARGQQKTMPMARRGTRDCHWPEPTRPSPHPRSAHVQVTAGVHPRPAHRRPPGPLQPSTPGACGWRLLRGARSPSASNQEDAAVTQRTPEAEPSSPPWSPRVTAPQHGLGGRNQPRTVLSRAAGSGDADTKGTRASPTWSRAVRAPARPLCARLRWPRPVTARGCRCPVSLPRAARPAAQRPLCLPALRPENCARGRRGASAH